MDNEMEAKEVSRKVGTTPQEPSGPHTSTPAATSLTAKWAPSGGTDSAVRACLLSLWLAFWLHAVSVRLQTVPEL